MSPHLMGFTSFHPIFPQQNYTTAIMHRLCLSMNRVRKRRRNSALVIAVSIPLGKNKAIFLLGRAPRPPRRFMFL